MTHGRGTAGSRSVCIAARQSQRLRPCPTLRTAGPRPATRMTRAGRLVRRGPVAVSRPGSPVFRLRFRLRFGCFVSRFYLLSPKCSRLVPFRAVPYSPGDVTRGVPGGCPPWDSATLPALLDALARPVRFDLRHGGLTVFPAGDLYAGRPAAARSKSSSSPRAASRSISVASGSSRGSSDAGINPSVRPIAHIRQYWACGPSTGISGPVLRYAGPGWPGWWPVLQGDDRSVDTDTTVGGCHGSGAGIS
jgi:hypothetical protein